MREKEWWVTLDILYDEQDPNPTVIRYAIKALTPQIALVRAGARLIQRMRQAQIMDARIEEAPQTGRVIQCKPKTNPSSAQG